jgi:hypothetical protein
MQKYELPNPDRPWTVTYSDGTKTRIMGRYTSRADAEMSIATMKRIVLFPMQIMWHGEVKDLESLASAK